MRTLNDIIDAVLDNEDVSREELYYGFLALRALHNFDHMAIMHMHTNPGIFNNPEHQWEESFNRYKRALNQDPKTWIGPNNDPANSEFQRRRSIGKKILDKIVLENNDENTK